MINAIEIKNFKSAEKLDLKFGRVNTFIGENGSGKSTILEALAFAVAAENKKLDTEYLENRGVRVTAPGLMQSQFQNTDEQPVEIRLFTNKGLRARSYIFDNKNSTYSEWEGESHDLVLNGAYQVDESETHVAKLKSNKAKEKLSELKEQVKLPELNKSLVEHLDKLEREMEEIFKHYENYLGDAGSVRNSDDFDSLRNFAIYTPENKQLRNLKQEGSFRPVGAQGQGLFRLLREISKQQPEALEDIEEMLKLIGWYEPKSIDLDNEPELVEDELFIKDKFLSKPFTQRSVNEGFLYVLFYAALIVSEATPKIFAIDNLDSALNPKLCTELMKHIYKLACKYDKQIFLTTHNPALLDGINLNDDQQKLFVVSRAKRGGQTKAKALSAKDKPVDSEGNPLRLSEAMLRGYLGGLPKGF